MLISPFPKVSIPYIRIRPITGHDEHRIIGFAHGVQHLAITGYTPYQTTRPTRVVRILLDDFWIITADGLLNILAGYLSFELTKTSMGADIVSPIENCGPNFPQHSKIAYRILPVLLG